MKRSRKPRKSRNLKIGHLYTVEWADHFVVSKGLVDDEDFAEPVIMRTTGILAKDHPTLFLFASSMSLGTNTSKIGTLHGVLKGTLCKIIDHGKVD